GDGG
ncbi:putative minor tail h domain protein, partial [Escherichia coli 3.4870]